MNGVLRRWIKETLGAVARVSGAGALLLRRRDVYRGIVVLSFHKVTAEPYFRPQMAVAREGFGWLLDFLVEQAEVVDLASAIAKPARNGDKSNRLRVALTIDDGYRDFYDHAFPELASRSLPATLFLTTGFLDDSARYPWWDMVALALGNRDRLGTTALALLSESFLRYGIRLEQGGASLTPPAVNACVDVLRNLPQPELELLTARLSDMAAEAAVERPRIMLNWDEVREMAAAGIRMGGHSLTHAHLDQVDQARVRREINQSRHRIEVETGRPVDGFAYPSGRWSPEVVRLVRKAGYRFACNTRSGVYRAGMDPLLIPRIDISDNVLRGVRSQFSPEMWVFQLLRQAR